MTIDERLQFLLRSTESLHSSVSELSANVLELSTTVQKHEQRWELLRKAVQAALRTFFQEGE
jgi:hypothetical protein